MVSKHQNVHVYVCTCDGSENFFVSHCISISLLMFICIYSIGI